ncbi:MAG: cytochrome c biogenesis protein CcdA [Cyanobacteria bacterium P01_G01_bin.4]
MIHWSVIGLAGIAGMVTLLSPCIMPILPILVGRSLHSHRFGPVCLVLGLAGSFAITGCSLGFSAQILGPLSHWLRQLAIALLLGLGLLSAFPKLRYWITQFLPNHTIQMNSNGGKHPLWTEVVAGTQLGVIWIPCAGPTLGTILTLIVADRAIISGFLALFFYALGAGIPMLVFAYSGQWVGDRLRLLFPYTEILQRVAGVAIAIAAISILMGWDVQIQLWLSPLFPSVPL